MEFTQEDITRTGFQLPAAPIDDWRDYDEHNPVPRYFDFDWLSARHPDLYHKFALTTVGLMNELNRLVDLAGAEVVEIGAGTGRAAIELARKAERVVAIDAYESVVAFGRDMVRQAGLRNVSYTRGDRTNLPLPSNSFDASICAWAILNHLEAYRVLKPDGYLIELGPAPGALCGELTATLADVFPELITEIAPADRYDANCPNSDSVIQDATWNGLPVTPPTMLHDFTYISDYGDYREAAAILGRLYGPPARRYMIDRQQSRLSWRLRIAVSRVRKCSARANRDQ